ncbi:MAG: cytochrome C oxidase subunit IV family protein [Pyrinomonadaceae bacterium]|nr:cytochrome C oxidase subunit IV family protein [Pyrinomonadaceae bacterium]
MSEHIVSKNLYFLIFGALMVLTAITVGVAFVNLGPLNNVVALTIAVIKALLVILYFMHVRYSSRLTWLVIVGGFFWLAIMFVLTSSDYLTRGWVSFTR